MSHSAVLRERLYGHLCLGGPAHGKRYKGVGPYLVKTLHRAPGGATVDPAMLLSWDGPHPVIASPNVTIETVYYEKRQRVDNDLHVKTYWRCEDMYSGMGRCL